MPIITIPNEDRLKLRAARHSIEGGAPVINGIPWQTVASATISASPSAYPITEYSVTSTTGEWSAIRPGQAYRIVTAGGDVLAYGVARRQPTATTFYPDVKSNGDPGYPRQIINPILNSHIIQVAKHHTLWSTYSALRGGVFYKNYDVPYFDQGSNPSPVANIGIHRTGKTTDAGTVQFAFTCSALLWGAKTVASWQWALDGGTVVSGGVQQQAVTASFAPGWYLISCTLTDTGLAQHTAYRYIVVNAPTTFPSWNEKYAITVTSDRQDRTGRDLTFEIDGIAATDVYPGQPLLMYEDARYDGLSLSSDTHRIASWIGYVSDESISYTRSRNTISLSARSPVSYAKALGAASQMMIESVLPANWSEVSTALSHPPGAIWYTLQHHAPAMLALHDYEFPSALTGLRDRSYKLTGTSIGSQLDAITKMVAGGNFGARSDGTLVFKQRATYFDNTGRNAAVTRFDWDEGDLAAPVETVRALAMPVASVRGYAFAYSGGSEPAAYASRAPGRVAAQGSGEDSITITVTPAGGQAELNTMTGHAFAEEAAGTTSVRTSVLGNIDICEPCDVDVWHRLNISSAYDPYSVFAETKRVLPTRISRTWRLNRGMISKSLSIEWQRESFGQPGITVPIERGDADDYLDYGWNLDLPVQYDPKELIESVLFAWNSAGKLGRTFDALGGVVRWEQIVGFNAGDEVQDAAVDWQSDLVTSGFEAGTLGLWVVTHVTSGNTITIWYVDDALAETPTVSAATNYTPNGTLLSKPVRIATSRTQNYAAVAWRTSSGVYVARYNGTWQNAERVGDNITDSNDASVRLGLAVRDDVIYASGNTATGWQYHRKIGGGAWAAQSAVATANQPTTLLHHDEATKLYVSRVIDATTATPGAFTRAPSGSGFRIVQTQPRESELPTAVSFGSKQGYLFSRGTGYVVPNEARYETGLERVELRAGTGPKNALVTGLSPSTNSGGSPNPSIEGGDWYRGGAPALRLQSHGIRGYNYLLGEASLGYIAGTGGQRWVLDLEYRPSRSTYDLSAFQWQVRTDGMAAGAEFDTPVVNDLAWLIDPDHNTATAALSARFETFAELLDANRAVLWTSPTTTFETLDNDGNLSAAGAAGPTVFEVEFTYLRTLTYALSPTINGVKYARVVLRNPSGDTLDANTTDVVTGISNRARLQARIGTVTFTPTTEYVPTTRQIFQITTPEGTPSSAEISILGSLLPTRAYGFAVDRANLTLAAATAENEEEAVIFDYDPILLWKRGANTAYKGVRVNASTRLYFGLGALDIVAGGQTKSLLGNWVQQIGDVGDIEGVIAFL